MAMALRPCFIAILIWHHAFVLTESARFAANGPILTLTLRDSSLEDAQRFVEETYSSPLDMPMEPRRLGMGALRPSLVWSVQSTQPPLPDVMPWLRSVKGTLGYQWSELKRLPSFLELGAKMSLASVGELQVQPTYDVRSGNITLQLQASRGASYLFARFLLSRRKNVCEALSASVMFNLPFASVSSMRVTPTMDLARKKWSLVVEGVTGGAGRTRAVMRLEPDHPTLGVICAIDERNVIRPEIGLYNARVVYHWDLLLPAGGSLHTKVDPRSAIELTWTDSSAAGGSWETDIRLPLDGIMVDPLAADVRVRRKFRF